MQDAQPDPHPPTAPAATLHPSLTPPGFDCAQCWYDLASMPIRQCPECGRIFREDELLTCRKRTQAADLLPPLVRRTCILLPNFIALITLLALLVTTSLAAAGITLLLTAGTGLGSWAAGWAAAHTAGKANIAPVRVAWTRCIPLLNAPWMMSPLVVLLLVAVVHLSGRLPIDGSSMSIAAAFGVTMVIGLWSICGIACLVRSGDRFDTVCETLGTRSGPWRGLFTLLIMGMSLASIMLAAALVFGALDALRKSRWIEW